MLYENDARSIHLFVIIFFDKKEMFVHICGQPSQKQILNSYFNIDIFLSLDFDDDIMYTIGREVAKYFKSGFFLKRSQYIYF